MERRALLLYLDNVRDLEVARYYIGRHYNSEKYSYESAINYNERQKSELIQIPYFTYESGGGCLLTFFLLLVACVAFMIFCASSDMNFLSVCALIDIIGLVALFIHFYPGTKSTQEETYNEKVAEIKKENQRIEASNKSCEQDIKKLKSEWDQKSKWYNSEYNKITSILTGFYNMNIIPVQYRNLASVIYLSDFMNTCEESFQTALFSAQIEEGIRRIERKLDKIMDLLVQQVYETRCLREENKANRDDMYRQNKQMLEQLSSIEKNSNDAAQYAQLSSNYSKASAYFSLATYLGNLKD